MTIPAMAPPERLLEVWVPVSLLLVAFELSARREPDQDELQDGAFIAGVMLVSPIAIVLTLGDSAPGPGAWPKKSVELFQFWPS